MKKNEIVSLLAMPNFDEIFLLADKIRSENVGDEIQIRAILEYSNYCKRACSYCGLNCNNKNLKRYRLSVGDIIDSAKIAHDVGYKTIVLQGGEDDFYNAKRLGEICKEINKFDMAITLSAGELPYDTLKYLYDMGAKRYLLKHETSDPMIYKALHPDAELKSRIDCLRNLKKIGYETGSGFMIGLPNQTLETIADDILLLKNIGCDMAGIGPFIPHPDTPLKDQPQGSYDLTLRAVAITRILLPNINLPATTSLSVIKTSEQKSVFNCGANVIMRKITPTEARKLYSIYPSKARETDILSERKELENYIIDLGKIPN